MESLILKYRMKIENYMTSIKHLNEDIRSNKAVERDRLKTKIEAVEGKIFILELVIDDLERLTIEA